MSKKLLLNNNNGEDSSTITDSLTLTLKGQAQKVGDYTYKITDSTSKDAFYYTGSSKLELKAYKLHIVVVERNFTGTIALDEMSYNQINHYEVWDFVIDTVKIGTIGQEYVCDFNVYSNTNDLDIITGLEWGTKNTGSVLVVKYWLTEP